VSFKYSGTYNCKYHGVRPMNPRICNIRKDVESWKELLELKRKNPLPSVYSNNVKYTFLPARTSWKEPLQRRNFFDQLARDLDFDPSDSESWYRITKEEVMKKQGARGVLVYHNQSYASALINLYPELGLKSYLFKGYQDQDWSSPQARRDFFDQLAHGMGFNPLQSEKWYSLRYKDVVDKKGSKVLSYHNSSHIKALMDLYPELNLDAHKFHTPPYKYEDDHNRREFFERLANDLEFDPVFEKDRWYHISRSDVTTRKGGHAVLLHHNGSHVQALMDLYPELTLQSSDFHCIQRYRR